MVLPARMRKSMDTGAFRIAGNDLLSIGRLVRIDNPP